MAGEQRKSWRELCIAALDAKNPDELLRILQELNRVLKHEEQIRHDFRHASKTAGSYEDPGEQRLALTAPGGTSNRVPDKSEIPSLGRVPRNNEQPTRRPQDGNPSPLDRTA
jgi:hypothetical protein